LGAAVAAFVVFAVSATFTGGVGAAASGAFFVSLIDSEALAGAFVSGAAYSGLDFYYSSTLTSSSGSFF
jgi:hypothetical protein